MGLELNQKDKPLLDPSSALPPLAEVVDAMWGQCEAKAAAILRQAIDRGDVRLLSQVATEYLHTRSGVAALEALGDWRFDQGRFDAAGRTWQQAAAMGEDAMRPCRLGKQVVPDNRGGAGGVLGTEMAAKSGPYGLPSHSNLQPKLQS